MARYLVPCLLSAAISAGLAVWATDAMHKTDASAQERSSPVRPAVEPPVTGSVTDLPAAARPAAADTAGATAGVPEPGGLDFDGFTPEEQINIGVYERANRGVVHITTRIVTREAFFSLEGAAAGSGSGAVLDKAGHVLTNWHVVEGAERIRVTLFNGDTHDAGLVGRDPASDVAVLRIDAPPEHLHPIPLGESTGLRVGQKVYAIGNPFGLERTLTIGILSSLNRRLPSRTGRSRDDIKSVIQIDAALNPGNSGGPLLDSHGRLIGVNTAIASHTQANTGVGFAIPVNMVKRVVPELFAHGRVLRPVIGIATVYETEQGLLVVEVVPDGPADRAGIRGFKWVTKRERTGPFITERSYLDRTNADLIVAVNGKRVQTGDGLLDIVESFQPGEQVRLTVVREGRMSEIAVTLGTGE